MRVLDVGCGFGHLGHALMSANLGVTVEGLESVRRDGELIRIAAYQGEHIPFDDAAFDVVIVADVLHHDPHPARLLREAARVASGLLIVKDHLREGILAQERISLLDWAANFGYDVPCTFRYNSLVDWHAALDGLGHIVEERRCIDIYPAPFNQILGRGLHYFAVISRAEHVERTRN